MESLEAEIGHCKNWLKTHLEELGNMMREMRELEDKMLILSTAIFDLEKRIKKPTDVMR